MRPINELFLEFAMGYADHVGHGLVEEKLPEVGYAELDSLFLSFSSVGSLHADYFPSELRNFRGAERLTRSNGDEQAHDCLLWFLDLASLPQDALRAEWIVQCPMFGSTANTSKTWMWPTRLIPSLRAMHQLL